MTPIPITSEACVVATAKGASNSFTDKLANRLRNFIDVLREVEMIPIPRPPQLVTVERGLTLTFSGYSLIIAVEEPTGVDSTECPTACESEVH